MQHLATSSLEHLAFLISDGSEYNHLCHCPISEMQDTRDEVEISPAVSYEITLVRPSVCLSVCSSVRPSLVFLKIGSLGFSDILHDDS